MKKSIKLGLFVASVGMLLSLPIHKEVNIPTFKVSAQDYYADINTSSAANLYNSLNERINDGWISSSYSALWDKLAYTDYDNEGIDDPNNTNRMVDIYSFTSKYSTGGRCGNYSAEGSCWNREHLIPKSWWGGNEEGTSRREGSDAFNMYPTDGKNNGMRSNYPFGEVSSPSYTGNLSIIKVGGNTFPGYTGTACEIHDKYKGDVARAYFYFITKNNDASKYTQGNGDAVFTTSNASKNFGLTEYAKNLFIKWHRLDPVSDWERERCDRVYSKQNNRNPYIDHPEYAEMIWGDGESAKIDVSSVSLNKTSIELNVGQTETLIATVLPTNATNKNVTWTSNNSNVASVNNGVITANGIGNAIITVTTADGNKTATCSVSVTSKVTPVSSVSLKDNSVTLFEEDIYELEYEILPTNASNKDVTWSSNNPNVVSVNNGIITAKSVGNARITITTVDGNKTDYVDVVVNPKPQDLVITYTPSAVHENAQRPASYTDDVLTVSYDKNTATTAPTYYDNGSAMRFYTGNTMIVSVEEGYQITKIEMTLTSTQKGSFSVDKGTLSSDNQTWTGAEDRVVFSLTTGKRYLEEMVVTYKKLSSSGDITPPTSDIISVEEALDIASTLSAGETTSEEYIVYGYIVDLDPGYLGESLNQKMTLCSDQNKGNGSTITMYGLKNHELRSYATEGAYLEMNCKIQNYNGTYELVDISVIDDSYSDNVTAFALKAFNDLQEPCKGGAKAISNSLWSSIAKAYNALTEKEQSVLTNISTDLTYSSMVIDFINRYTRIVEAGKDDFMDRGIQPKSVNNFYSNNDESNILLFASLSLLSASLLTATLIIKRRKHSK